MKSLRFFILAFITLNCSPAWLVTDIGMNYKVKTTHDKFDGYTKNVMQYNLLSGGGLLGAKVYLDIQQFETKNGHIVYSLIARYYGENWLFIEEGESLILLVDGESIRFSGEGSSRHRNVISGGKIMEHAWFSIKKQTLIINYKKINLLKNRNYHFITFSSLLLTSFKSNGFVI